MLARRGTQVTGYPESVATTWDLSFQRVEQVNPAATELLHLCALLSPDHIPEELLTQGAPHWPPALQQAVANRFTFNHMLEALLAFSLVKRLADDHLLSIHRLVQVVQMERMPQREQRQWAERLIRAVHVVFPCDPEDPVATWPQCQRYLEQAQACDALIQEHHLLLPEAAEVLDRTGIYLRERALYNLAEPLFQRALRIQEQQVRPEHLPVADPLYNLAVLYFRQGKYAEAEPFHQRALRIREHQAGPEDPLVAASLNGLALLYQAQGKYTEAEPLFKRALHIQEQQLGPEHPETAEVQHDFAGFQLAQGKSLEAAVLYQHALMTREHVFGPDHPMTTDTYERLHTVLVALERVEEAARERSQPEP